jgi:hypothetical protein
MTRFHPLRTTAATVVVILTTLLAGTACTGRDPAVVTSVATPPESTTTKPTDLDHLSYVAFGASWPYGAHCGMCETFVTYYARYVEEATGLPVDFDNRTTNGGGTHEFLDTLQHDRAARASVARADIVILNGGINDLDRTGALDKVAAGTCGGDGSRCLRAMRQEWRHGFEAILDKVDQLTAGREVAVRLVGEQNIFLSDPSIITDYGLPDNFALEGGQILIREMASVMATVARRHGAEFVDVWRLFNGPAHDQPWDENTPEAHQAVARAILDTGLDPLDLD